MKTTNMLKDRAWLLGLAFLVLLAASDFRDAGSADSPTGHSALLLSASHEAETQ